MTSRLREALRNDHRLDLLCLLSAERAMTVPELSEGTGMSTMAVAFFLDILEEKGVVRETGRTIGPEPVYEAHLDEQPAWVREVVERHCPDAAPDRR